MKRQAMPQLSPSGKLAPASIRNYLSDVRHFIAWYKCHMDTEVHIFTPQTMQKQFMRHDPSAPVKLVGQEGVAPRHLRLDQVKLGKHNKYREVPLNITACDVLEEYLSTLPSHTIFLFPSDKTKGPLSERMLGYIIKKYADGAKLTDVSPHDLRHRFSYRMAESIPLHRLAQIMGHDSLDTTKLYIQGTKQDLQRAVETIAWV
jgi:Phage integrase family